MAVVKVGEVRCGCKSRIVCHRLCQRPTPKTRRTGNKLFGEELNSILVESRDKTKSMPKYIKKQECKSTSNPSLYSYQSSFHPRQDTRGSSWNIKKFQPRKGFAPCKTFGQDKLDQYGRSAKP
uniref:Uncharacterized protein n=1 Tax=Sphaerodactylus townsendi TaxID=933632 RepID=A0ACB8GA88_9SAUR